MEKTSSFPQLSSTGSVRLSPATRGGAPLRSLLGGTLLLGATLFVAPDASAAIYNGPYLMEAGQTSVKVLWETDEPSSGEVEYGTSVNYTSTVQAPALKTIQVVSLTGLQPNTRYYYAINDFSGDRKTGSFMTAPAPGTNFTFGVYGDNRSNPDDHAAVAAAILAKAPRFVVTTGDYVEDAPILQEWHNQFFVPAASLLANTPIIPAIGNHESGVGHPNSPVWDYFPRPGTTNYYSVDYGDIHFVMVDSNITYGTSSPQYAWLQQDLAKTTKPVILVAHHFPVYSSGNHGSTLLMDKTLRPLYEQYGVTAVLSGHDHMYERSVRNNVQYFVLGGGGAGLYDPNDTRNPYLVKNEKTHHFGIFSWANGQLSMTAYRKDGTIIEQVPLYGPGVARAGQSVSDSGAAALSTGEAAQKDAVQYDTVQNAAGHDADDLSTEAGGCGQGDLGEDGAVAAGMAGLALLAGLGFTTLRRARRSRQ